MRFLAASFIFIFLLQSCSNTSLKEPKEDVASKQALRSTFECNYSKYKTNSKSLYQQYINSPEIVKKQKLINNVRDSLFPCWYGTEWDYYGTTEEPGNGKIACGYFVTTLLRDMSVPVNRIKHAQCASEEMIKAVCKVNSISRYRNKPDSVFMEKIAADGIGLYIVGLDFHTGFILNDGRKIYFIHANYAGKKVVMSEIASESSVLSTSKYKVIGKVF